MSILNEQLLTHAGTPSTAINPFPKATEWEGTPSVGFGGYTYAPEGLAGKFNADVTRTGPQADGDNLGTGTHYGPVGRRLASGNGTGNSLLGQMADMTGGVGYPAWNTDGGGKKMAHTFTNSQQLKSLRNHQIGPGGSAEASGGPAVGYDFNNTYGVSNWDVAGTLVTKQTHSADDIADMTAILSQNALETWMADGETTEIEDEAFRPTTDITTGLRNPLFADPQS